MIEELFVALNLAANSVNPVLVPDVFSTGHSHGQYVFYAAADKAHGIDEQSPKKINENTMKVSFIVDVSFEEDTFNVATAEIEDVKSRLARGSKYEQFRENIQMNGPGGFLDVLEAPIVLLPIEAGDNWASWIYGSQHLNAEPSLRVSFQAVEGNRTVSIKAYSVSDDFTLEEIIEHWQTLVDKYRDMPMKIFTGSPVE